MSNRIHLTEEDVYDIFRQIFHNEEDALAATIQLFRGDPIGLAIDAQICGTLDVEVLEDLVAGMR